MNEATTWVVNAEFTDPVSCNSGTHIQSPTSSCIPRGAVWKLIVLLKLLKSFSVEEFEIIFDCLIN